MVGEERNVDRVTRRRRSPPHPSRHPIIYQWSKRGNDDLLFLSIYRPVYYSEVDQCLPQLFSLSFVSLIFLSLQFPFNVTSEIYSTIARSLTRSLTFSLGLVVCVIIFIIIQSFSLVVSYKSFVKLMSSFKKEKKKNIKNA